MNTLFKDLQAGSVIYALIKKEDGLQFEEGTIVSVGKQRIDMPKMDGNNMPDYSQLSSMKNVVDVTYCIAGKNYTDTVNVTDYMFPTEKTGAITLIATDKEPILRELHATRKKAEDYLNSVDTMVPRNRKRVQDCDALIARLDTAYAEKQQMESRMQKLEEGNAAIEQMLNKILNKLEKQ